MSVYGQLKQGAAKLSLIGLCYAGMPIVVEFSKHVPVVGFDVMAPIEKWLFFKGGKVKHHEHIWHL